MHREISAGVLVVEARVADGKIGVIAGSGIALAVDTGIDETEGAAVLAAARSLERDEVHLVYTHGHYDHVLGGGVFRDLPIHARRELPDHMRAQLPDFAKLTETSPQELEARLGWPTDVFTREADLDLGGRTVRFVDSPGHAPGSICVFDPHQGVLFGGDTLVTAIPPAFTDGDGVVLAATLRRLAALDSEVLIPGHGAVIIGRDAVRAAIEWPAAYLERCGEVVEANNDADEATLLAAAPYDEFIGDRLPKDRHRMEWRHEQTLRTLVAQRATRVDARNTRHV